MTVVEHRIAHKLKMEITETLFYTIFVPSTLVIIRALVGDEIRYWLSLLQCFFVRPFDLDNNTDTHDWLMVYNEGNGSWECCSVTFKFGLRKDVNGVYIHHYDDAWNLLFKNRVSFEKWFNLDKATINKDNLPVGLYNKIKSMQKHHK